MRVQLLFKFIDLEMTIPPIVDLGTSSLHPTPFVKVIFKLNLTVYVIFSRLSIFGEDRLST